MFGDAPEHRGKDWEGQGRKQQSGWLILRQTAGLRIRLCAGLCKRLPELKGMARKQGIIVNTSNQ